MRAQPGTRSVLPISSGVLTIFGEFGMGGDGHPLVRSGVDVEIPAVAPSRARNTSVTQRPRERAVRRAEFHIGHHVDDIRRITHRKVGEHT